MSAEIIRLRPVREAKRKKSDRELFAAALRRQGRQLEDWEAELERMIGPAGDDTGPHAA